MGWILSFKTLDPRYFLDDSFDIRLTFDCLTHVGDFQRGILRTFHKNVLQKYIFQKL